MRAKEIQELLQRQPFSPLRIFLTDGTQYDVRHPDQVLVNHARLDIGVRTSGEGASDHTEYVSILHVVRIVPIQPSPAKSRSFSAARN